MKKARTRTPKVIIGDGTLSKEEEDRMVLLLILHWSERQFAEGKFVPAAEAFKRVRARLQRRSSGSFLGP
jgi:hypothetical protein